jgi:phosphoribosylformimino-5-aminoimidazole carboxamide ribotide isomerase
VAASAGNPIAGDPAELARVYAQRFGMTTLYAADLDAIAGTGANHPALRAIAAHAPVWVDAGVSSKDDAAAVAAGGAARVIAGLETIASVAELGTMCASLGTDRVALSIDLRSRAPLGSSDLAREGSPEAIAARAAAVGVSVLIVLDVARVGASGGPDFELLSRVRGAVPRARLYAAGGVRSFADLERLSEINCDGALIATAIHRGLLTTNDIRAARALGGHRTSTR